jgi:hypothetical protein
MSSNTRLIKTPQIHSVLNTDFILYSEPLCIRGPVSKKCVNFGSGCHCNLSIDTIYRTYCIMPCKICTTIVFNTVIAMICFISFYKVLPVLKINNLAQEFWVFYIEIPLKVSWKALDLNPKLRIIINWNHLIIGFWTLNLKMIWEESLN